MSTRHVFLWSVRDDAADGQRVLDELAGLRGQMPGLEGLVVGRHVGDQVHTSGGRYDYALVCDFADAAALAAYQEHPAHVEVTDRVMPLYADWAVVDLALP